MILPNKKCSHVLKKNFAPTLRFYPERSIRKKRYERKALQPRLSKMNDQATLSEATSPASVPDGGKGLGAESGSAVLALKNASGIEIANCHTCRNGHQDICWEPEFWLSKFADDAIEPHRSACSAVVFRVQDRDGRGPWKPGFSDRWVEDRTDAEYDALAPFPLEVLLSLRRDAGGGHMGFGCTSPEQLRLWFRPGEYRWLMRHGYHAVKMEVDAILAASASQCAFARSKPLRAGVERVELYPQNEKGER